jgi:hypothetical protein
LRTDSGNSAHQGVAQLRLFDDRNHGPRGRSITAAFRVGRDQNFRHRNVRIPEHRDQVPSVYPGHSLVNEPRLTIPSKLPLTPRHLRSISLF